MLPNYAERALAPFSPSSYGICSIINRLTIDSIANPHLNDEPGTIITFLDEMFGLVWCFILVIGQIFLKWMKIPFISTTTGPIRSTIYIQSESLEVYTYTPKSKPARSLLFLFDGVHRDAAGICNKAIGVSEQYGLSLIAPLMEKRKFPSWRYQLAGIVRNGILQPKTGWTFIYIQGLIDYMLEHAQHEIHNVILFGHSAGGQLLSRICAYTPLSDVNSVVIANPSSYVMPLLDEPAPYGFEHIFQHRSAEARLKSYLSAPITIYLGMEDVEELHLSTSRFSMQQGRNRLERGRRVYHVGQQVALMHRLKFNWRLVEIPDVGHSSREMLNSKNFAKVIDLTA